MSNYDIKISKFRSAGVREVAKDIGIPYMRKIGGGYAADGACVGFYALPLPPPHPNGWEIRVAVGAGSPMWEDEDPQEFGALAAACGIKEWIK